MKNEDRVVELLAESLLKQDQQTALLGRTVEILGSLGKTLGTMNIRLEAMDSKLQRMDDKLDSLL